MSARRIFVTCFVLNAVLGGCAGYQATQWKKPEPPNQSFVEWCETQGGFRTCELVTPEEARARMGI